MRVRALTSNGDYAFGQSGQNFLVNSAAAVAQLIQTALQLMQGEWFLNLSVGTPYGTQILGFGTTGLYDAAIQAVIQGVQGVQQITDYSSTLNGETRVLTIDAAALTSFGPVPITAVVGAPAQPPIPLNFAGAACDGEVLLTWSAVPGTTYAVYRSAVSDGVGPVPVAVDITGGSVELPAANGTAWYYALRAFIGGIASEPTAPIAVTANPLTPPTATATVNYPAGSITIGWSAVAGAAGYNLLRSTTSGTETLYQANVSGLSYTDTDVTPGTTYFYQVQVLNVCGQAYESAEVSATPSTYALTVLADNPSSYVRNTSGVNLGSVGAAGNFSIGSGIASTAGLLTDDADPGIGVTYQAANCYMLNDVIGNLMVPGHTFEVWVRIDGGASNQIIAAETHDSNGNPGVPAGINLSQSVGAQALGLGTTSSGSVWGRGNISSFGGAMPEASQRYHLVGYAGTTSGGADDPYLMLNGVPFGTSITPFSSGTSLPSGVIIGGYWNSGDAAWFGLFTGEIDEVAAYSYKLPQARALAHYAVGSRSAWGFTDYVLYTAIDAGDIALSGASMNIATRGANNSGTNHYRAATTAFFGAQKTYMEFVYATAPGSPVLDDFSCGITTNQTNSGTIGTHSPETGYTSSGRTITNNFPTTGYPAIVQGDVIGIAVDEPNGNGWFLHNNVPLTGDPELGTSPTFTFTPGTSWRATQATATQGSVVQTNQQASSFVYPPPSGFTGVLNVPGVS